MNQKEHHHRQRQRQRQRRNLKDLTSLEAESQVCERVLTHLAKGTTPQNFQPNIPNNSNDINNNDDDNDDDDDNNNNSNSNPINQQSMLIINSTYSQQDEIQYNNKTDFEHQQSLTVALSILLDSTSPGPDPLALQFLGWAYGGGGGGGMGDWDGCHYMPGSIGSTLRVLQDQVVLQLVHEYSSKSNLNETDYLSQKKAWWLQSHEVEYGEGYERSATRFCTIGGVPPHTVPYTKGGVLWGPPLAGVCVPSSCTSDALYLLFDQNVGFAESLLNMASRDGFYDHNNQPDSSSTSSPPTASRRFRYMSSLAQSFNAGRLSQMGIVCEGESGLAELDQEGYYSRGYYGTVGLTWVLLLCVILGTISASWIHTTKKHGYDGSSTTSSSNGETETDNEAENGENESKTKKGDTTRNDALLMQRIPPTNYGSNHDNGKNLYAIHNIRENKSISFLDPDNNEFNSSTHSSDYNIGISTIGEDENEDDPLLQSDREIQFISNEERRGIELQKSASFSLSERRARKKEGNTMFTSAMMVELKSRFAYFDAGQSFYEITRMTREDPYADSLHQQRLRKAGETSLDPSSSTPGLFPMYKALTPVRKGTIDPDYTVSVSSSKCLNGMRSISMLWIIFGHTLAVSSSVGYVNPAALLPPTGMMTSPLGKIVISARYAVDTFFFIGGFLVMSGLLKRLDPKLSETTLTEDEEKQVNHWKEKMIRWGILNPKHLVIGEYVNRLKQLQQQQGASSTASATTSDKHVSKSFLWVIPFLLHRILRILPTYGFVLLLWWKVAVTMGDGPFWPRWATFVAQCDAHAWTNMLFVNNLIPWNQPNGEMSECMYHAWYLGIDFQLCVVLAPIFVTLYLRNGWRKRTILLEICTIVVIILVSFYCSVKNNWSEHLWDGADTVAFDRGFYINPFFRSSPYIIGFIAGQIWHEKCRLCPNIGLTKLVSISLSFISIVTMVYWTVFSGGAINNRPCLVWESPRDASCGSGWSSTKLAFFNSFGRPVWGTGLALMSLLSFNGQMTFLSSSAILNWPGWDPISKLSFSMYLLHPLIINVWVLGGADKFRFSIKDFFFDFSGIVLITFLSALIIGVLVEWPISRITRDFEKRLWSKRKGKDS